MVVTDRFHCTTNSINAKLTVSHVWSIHHIWIMSQLSTQSNESNHYSVSCRTASCINRTRRWTAICYFRWDQWGLFAWRICWHTSCDETDWVSILRKSNMYVYIREWSSHYRAFVLIGNQHSIHGQTKHPLKNDMKLSRHVCLQWWFSYLPLGRIWMTNYITCNTVRDAII